MTSGKKRRNSNLFSCSAPADTGIITVLFNTEIHIVRGRVDIAMSLETSYRLYDSRTLHLAFQVTSQHK